MGGGGGGGGGSPQRQRPPGMESAQPTRLSRDTKDKPWGENRVSTEIPAWMLERKKQMMQQQQQQQENDSDAPKEESRATPGGDGSQQRSRVSWDDQQVPQTSQGQDEDDEALQLAGGLNSAADRSGRRGPIGQSLDAPLGSVTEEQDVDDSPRSSVYSTSVPGTPPSLAGHSDDLGPPTEEQRQAIAQAHRVMKSVIRTGDALLGARVAARIGPEAAARAKAGDGAAAAEPPSAEGWTELSRTECIQDCLEPRFATSVTVARLGEEPRQRHRTVRWLRVVVLDVDGDGVDLSKDDLCGETYLDMDDCIGELAAQAGGADSGHMPSFKRKELALKRPKDKKQRTYGTLRLILEPLRRAPRGSVGGGALKVSMRAAKLVNVEGWMGKSDPFCVWRRELPADDEGQSGGWVTVHRTEWIKNSLDPMWEAFDVPISALCGGDRDTTRGLELQVFDFEKNDKHRLLGSVRTSVAELLSLKSDTDASGGSAAELALEWPKDGELAEKAAKAAKKGKATEEAGSLLFDVVALLPGSANDLGSNPPPDEQQFLVSVECDGLPKMDTLSKSDPIAVFYTQETQPRPKDLDKTLVGSMALRAARRKTSVAKILASTPELGRVRALRG